MERDKETARRFRDSFDMTSTVLNADKNMTIERPGSFNMHVIYGNHSGASNGTGVNESNPNVANDNKTTNSSSTPDKNFNMNMREDDVYSIVIVTQDLIAKMLRSELAKGLRLTDVDEETLKTVKRDLFQYYVFSSKLTGYAHGTQHYSSIWPEEVKTKEEKKLEKTEQEQIDASKLELDAHGINEHVIVLSLNDLVKNQLVLRWLITKTINLVDPSVIVINQIMFTFHR